jgi:hypothetical protein
MLPAHIKHSPYAALIRFKVAIYRAWRVNLMKRGLTAPLPPYIWRLIGAK